MTPELLQGLYKIVTVDHEDDIVSEDPTIPLSSRFLSHAPRGMGNDLTREVARQDRDVRVTASRVSTHCSGACS